MKIEKKKKKPRSRIIIYLCLASSDSRVQVTEPTCGLCKVCLDMVRKPEESMVETGTDGGGKDLVAAIPDCQILQNSNYLVFFKVNLCLVSQVVNQSTRQASVITRILSLMDAVTQPTHPASFYPWL